MPLLSPRAKAALQYLRRADKVYAWRISRATCPNCGGHFFISLSNDGFMTRCLSCAANVTNLSIIPVIERHMNGRAGGDAWEMSTYGATLNYLRRHFSSVLCSEYFSGVPSGELVNGILNEDAQNLSFADESLDIVTSNQVFEHVPDDLKAYQECYRVLRPGGALIFTVPLYDTPQTIRMAEIVEGELRLLAPPEYHDSRTAGANTALVFWRHSVFDICDRVARAGFDVELVDIIIPPSQTVPSHVVYAHKTTRGAA